MIDERHQSAAPAVADVIRDRRRRVADPGGEIFSAERADRPWNRGGKQLEAGIQSFEGTSGALRARRVEPGKLGIGGGRQAHHDPRLMSWS